jgi:glycosyltransferase involved in cell wall biosynthesis
MLAKKPFVSILTPTYNRRFFIPQFLKIVRNQVYNGPIEILVADDGTDPIYDLIKNDSAFRYIRFDEKKPLGYKRNLLASQAKGEILIHFDDDDYYPPSRVSHAVESLMKSEKLIAGSSLCHIYDTSLKKIFVSGPFGQNHATAGTFAYKKEYIKNNKFNDEAIAQEEPSFTGNFSNNLIQLDALKTILIIKHAKNTWDKQHTRKKLSAYKLRDFIQSNNDRRFYLQNI